MESLTEIWKDVKDYEGQYEVSSRGRVRSLPRCVTRGEFALRVRGRVLRPWKTGSGYLSLRLNDDRHQVHRIVASAFIGCAMGRHVNHIDGDKENNSPANLEYVTPKENTAHAMATGLMPRAGEENPAAKNSAEQIQRAYAMVAGGATYAEAAAATGATRPAIVAACTGRTWKSLGLAAIRREPCTGKLIAS